MYERLWWVRRYLPSLMIGMIFASAAFADDYLHFQVGDPTAPTPGKVSGGLLLMGGGDRNLEALRWFIAKAGHGHIVVLRASQTTDVADELYHAAGEVTSVETFVFKNRDAATDPRILASLAKADGIFIAGGDQSRYVRFWRDTPVVAALNAHVATGKPLGGTSAGLAILGEYLYGAMDGGSLTSPAALADPHGTATTIESHLLDIELLRGILTDTHFKERDRLGRLFAFLTKAKALQTPPGSRLWGLAVDESAALALEPDGTGKTYATALNGAAWLVSGSFKDAQQPGRPLNLRWVEVIGVGHGSLLHLKERTVDNPVFARRYTVVHGEIVELPR